MNDETDVNEGSHEYQLLAAVDTANRASAELYTSFAFYLVGTDRSIEAMHKNLSEIEYAVDHARSELYSLESIHEYG